MFRPMSSLTVRSMSRIVHLPPLRKDFVVYHTFFPYTSGIDLMYVPFQGPVVGLFSSNKMFVDLKDEKDRYAIDRYATQHGIDAVDLKEPVRIVGTMRWHDDDLDSVGAMAALKPKEAVLAQYMSQFG